MSITEVAERAGVSRATVSLVINNKATISAKTTQIVRRAIAEVGYVPPERRRGRRAVPEVRTRIALASASPNQVLRTPVFTDAAQGIERAAHDAKSDLLLFQCERWDEMDTARLRSSVDGVIFFGGRPTPDQLEHLAGLPVVAVMGFLTSFGALDHISVKHEAVGDLAAKYLINRGHKLCAQLVINNQSMWRMRKVAFEDAVEAAGGSALNISVRNAVRDLKDSQVADREVIGTAIDQILSATPRPTGLFLPMDIFAAPVYMQLMERGIKPGLDIEIVSCNNERPLLNGLHPMPGIVDIHAFEIGQAAVERLLWRMKHPTAPIADILLQPTLIPGK